MAMTQSTSPARLGRERALIFGATLILLAGIGLSASDFAGLGKWAVLAGLALLLAGLHRFGRAGPDAPIEPTLPKKARKKRRRDAAD
jgi:hypothetical protein